MSLVVRSENTAVELPEQQTARNQQIAQIADWAQAAQAAHQVAKGLCETSFVPRAYQGKPMEATAAILAGAEVGLSPMASLRAFDSIQGTPAPKAMTLRAIVQGVGHEVRIDKSDETVAVVAARRRGDTEWQRSTWTIERARKMGLTSKDQWKNQPQAMLIARATAEVCRWIAADAIMGMPYTAEEILDQDAGDVREAPRRVSVDEIDAVDDEPAPASPEPASAPQAAAEPMTKTQQGRMFALFAEKGIGTPAAQREYVASSIGRQIASRGDLTKDEAGKVIDDLEQLPTPAPAVDMGGAELDDPIDGELQ